MFFDNNSRTVRNFESYCGEVICVVFHARSNGILAALRFPLLLLFLPLFRLFFRGTNFVYWKMGPKMTSHRPGIITTRFPVLENPNTALTLPGFLLLQCNPALVLEHGLQRSKHTNRTFKLRRNLTFLRLAKTTNGKRLDYPWTTLSGSKSWKNDPRFSNPNPANAFSPLCYRGLPLVFSQAAIPPNLLAPLTYAVHLCCLTCWIQRCHQFLHMSFATLAMAQQSAESSVTKWKKVQVFSKTCFLTITRER